MSGTTLLTFEDDFSCLHSFAFAIDGHRLRDIRAAGQEFLTTGSFHSLDRLIAEGSPGFEAARAHSRVLVPTEVFAQVLNTLRSFLDGAPEQDSASLLQAAISHCPTQDGRVTVPTGAWREAVSEIRRMEHPAFPPSVRAQRAEILLRNLAGAPAPEWCPTESEPEILEWLLRGRPIPAKDLDGITEADAVELEVRLTHYEDPVSARYAAECAFPWSRVSRLIEIGTGPYPTSLGLGAGLAPAVRPPLLSADGSIAPPYRPWALDLRRASADPRYSTILKMAGSP